MTDAGHAVPKLVVERATKSFGEVRALIDG